MTARKKRFRILLSLIAILLLALIVWTLWGNTAPELNRYTVSIEKLPQEFSGYRIAHISDLHNTELGKGNKKLLKLLREAEPDIIAITGDMIDSRNTKIEVALQFAADAVQIAPCYYVTGNHEERISEYPRLKAGLEALGVTVLTDARVELERSGKTVALLGVDDPSFQSDRLFGDEAAVMEHKLQALTTDDTCMILLSHRPELFEIYVQSDVDLVLSGHAHGGQFRLPFVGGLAAPNQGLFPQYDAGLFTEENTNMIVSRGIGNSIVPLRFNNRPEVILIELQSSGGK